MTIKIDIKKENNVVSLPAFFANVVDVDKNTAKYEILYDYDENQSDKITKVDIAVNTWVADKKNNVTNTKHVPTAVKSEHVYTKQLVSAKDNSVNAITAMPANSAVIKDTTINSKKLLSSGLFKGNSDASDIVEATETIPGAKTLQDGTVNKAKIANKSSVKVVADYIDASIKFGAENDKSDVKKMTVISTQKSTRQTAYVNVPLDDLKNSSLVTFELTSYDASGNVTSVVTRSHDVREAVNHFTIPKTVPNVSYVKKQNSVRFEITNIEKFVVNVNVFVRRIGRYARAQNAYEFVGKFPAMFGKCVAEITEVSLGPNVYRFVAESEFGRLSSEFTSVVITNDREVNSNDVVMIPKTTVSGIEFDVKKVPENVVSYALLRKNLTLKESEFEIIGQHQFVDTDDSTDFPNLIDTTPKERHCYEYSLTAIYENGITKNLSSVFYEYIASDTKSVDMSVTNVLKTPVDNETADVSFDIVAQVKNTDIDSLKALIQQNGYTQQFSSDIEKQKDELKGLLTFNVTRTDELTGETIDYGVVSNTTFTESVVGKQINASPLLRGRNYTYAVTPLVRKSETLFDALTKDAIGKRTGKKYAYSPFKSFHPKTLRTGAIVTKESERYNDARSRFEHGRVGLTTIVEVSFADAESVVTESNLARFDVDSVTLSWRTTATSRRNPIDYFIVYRKLDDIKEAIGKSFSVGGKDELTYSYLHELNRDDLVAESLDYYIAAVNYDGTMSRETYVGRVEIEK